MQSDLTTSQLATYMISTVGDNMPALFAVIAVSAGVKIFLDILFRYLYNITSAR